MKPITHMLFSESFCMVFAAFANVILTPVAILVIAVSSILPDIDDTKSMIGRVFYKASNHIERTFGRRTITHSLLGLLIVAIIISPLLFFKVGILYSMILFSILGHIIIDCVNKEGVNLFYPNLVRAVIPRDEKTRIEENSKTENVLSYVFIGLILALYPLNQMGIKPALHYLIRTPEAAVTDYTTFSGQGYRVMVDFEGIKNISQEKVKGVWEAIDLAAKNSLIIKDKNGKLYRIGNDVTDNIRPITIRAIKGKKQNQLTQELNLKNNLLSDILPVVPKDIESYISGYVKTDGAIPIGKEDIDSYQAIRQISNKIELSSATIDDLIEKGLLNVFVEEGQIIVRTIYPADKTINSLSSQNNIINKDNILSVTVKGVNNVADVMVKEGDSIKKGQILAVSHEKKNLKLIEIEKENTRLAAVKAELNALKLKMSDELTEKEQEDAILGIKRELKELKGAHQRDMYKLYSKIYLTHLNIKKLSKTLKSLETPSPCDGKVISVYVKKNGAAIRIIENI